MSYGLDVRSLAVDTISTNIVYAGTYGGGIFKSTDGADTWNAANTGLTNYYVYALAVDPTVPTIVYAGTGNGVFKSTDGAGSWSPASTGITSAGIRDLAVDPVATSFVYAVTWMGGVFKSTDGAASWNPANTGLVMTNMYAMTIDPRRTNILFVGANGASMSDDYGATWTSSNTGMTNLDTRALAVDPAAPNAVYAGTYGGGVFASTDGGATWAAHNTGLTGLNVQALALDPAAPNRIYAGANGGVFSIQIVIPPPGAFDKTSPSDGSYANTSPVFEWDTSSGALGYEFCFDTVNNDACDGSWIWTGSTAIGIGGLTSNETYYWQVRAVTVGASTGADGGAWFSVTARTQTFADVPVNHTLWQYIEALYASGITTGCGVSPLIFCPENNVTRAAMAVFLLRAEHGSGYTPPASGHIFADLPVAGKEWQEVWVNRFYSEGITTGCGTGPLIYCPENPVTRAAMAVFILRTLEGSSYTPPAASHYFADLPVAGKEWMEPWVDELYRRGITTGCGTGPLIYCPENPVKRQAMAAFIVRAFNLPLP
jgi:hypothetical protein